MTRQILHEGLVLRPLTPAVIARLPDLDPVRHDALAAGRGWINFKGVREPARLIKSVCRPNDDLYYWDGPFGVLSGSRGIAVVRQGAVVASFTTIIA